MQERQEKAEEKFALERKRPRGKEVNQAKYQHFNHNARNTQHCLENTENQTKLQHFNRNALDIKYKLQLSIPTFQPNNSEHQVLDIVYKILKTRLKVNISIASMVT